MNKDPYARIRKIDESLLDKARAAAAAAVTAATLETLEPIDEPAHIYQAHSRALDPETDA